TRPTARPCRTGSPAAAHGRWARVYRRLGSAAGPPRAAALPGTAPPPEDARSGASTSMHIVILGCGRVGSTLAHALEDAGHTVAVIDRAPDAFRRLRPSTASAAVRGLGHDREVLVKAGIETASAFAAVS